jgi:predicted Mrr-cat superfamily restriction endonuclease
VKPTGKSSEAYAQKLIGVIEQEFEHNLAQQIYVSDTAWKAVKTSKSVMVKIIRSASEKEEVKDVQSLQAEIMKSVMNQEGPTQAALAFLRLEVQKLF